MTHPPDVCMDSRTPGRLALRLPADPACLPWIEERVHEYLAPLGLEEEVHFRIRLVLEEILTNIIKYAYGGSGRGEIVLEIEAGPGGAGLTFRDRGPAFDPLDHPEPDTRAPLEDRPVGKLGLHLVRTLCRDMDYQRSGGQNVLRAVVGFPPPAAE